MIKKSKSALLLFAAIVMVYCPTITAAQDDPSINSLQTGSFTIEKSIRDLLGNDVSQSEYDWIDIEKPLAWEINVPANYDSNNAPGVFVYISPQNEINIPSGWLSVTDEKNLIWIAALSSGNNVPANERIMKAVLALEVVQSKYRIDTDRIYISGFSGGGRVASLTATYYPGIFSGALYICGANPWSQSDPEQLERIKENRFVFLTGTKDFNLNDTKSVYGKYKKAGVNNSKLMVVNRMGHSNPKRSKFNQALTYLDEN